LVFKPLRILLPLGCLPAGMANLPETFELKTLDNNDVRGRCDAGGRVVSVSVIDEKGQIYPLGAEAAISFENWRRAQGVAGDVLSDAQSKLDYLRQFGDPESLRGILGFKPYFNEYEQLASQATQMNFLADFHRSAGTRYADRLVRDHERRARDWLNDVNQISENLGGNGHLPLKSAGGRGPQLS
jgi:hypothetical protein